MNQTSIRSNLKSEKKHFIFVIDAFTKGGAQRNLELVLPEMIELGAQIDLILLQNSTEELNLKKLQSSGVQIHRIVARNMYDVTGFFKFLKVTRKKDSVIVANLFWSQIWSALVAHPARFQKLFWVEHNTYLNRTNSHWLFYSLLSRRAIAVLAVSAEIADFLQKRVNIRVQLVNNAALSLHSRGEFPVDFFRFLFVGRLVDQKNPILALEAFKHAIDSGIIPEDSNLNVIGDGPLRNEMEAYVNTNNLDGKVEFLGFLEREEVSKIMSVSQTLIMTSHHEGSPLVRLEALVHGMTIVTTRTAGISGILTQEFSDELLPGVFVAESNVESLTINLGLSISPTFWTTDVFETRVGAAQKFSPEQVAKIYLHLA